MRKERIKDCLNEMCDTKDQMETVLKNLKVQFDGLGLTITAADLNTAAPKKKKKKPADADALERRGWTALHYELRARSLPDRGTTRDLAERLAAALAAPPPSDEALEVPAATPTSLAEEESSDNTCVNQGTEQQTWFIPVSKSTLHVVEFDTAVDGAAAESAAEGADKPSEPPAAETPPEPSAAAQTSDADPAGEVTCVIEEWPDGTEEQTWHIPVSTEEAARAARNLRAASAAATASSLLRAGAKRAKTRRASAIGTHLARFPDPEAEKADFEKLVAVLVAHKTQAVLDRRDELHDAITRLQSRGDLDEAALDELEATHGLLADFAARWKWRHFDKGHGHRVGLSREQVEHDRLEKVVARKVRSDLTIAHEMDMELSEMSCDREREKKLLELMRFEHLNPTEQAIYRLTFCLDEEVHPEPVAAWKKRVSALVMVVLTLFPAYYLLLFGLQQGRATTRAWLVGTAMCMALEILIYDIMVILFLFIAAPMLIRGKLKHLSDPTDVIRFPYRTELHERPTSYLTHKYHHLKVARAVRHYQHDMFAHRRLDDAPLPRADAAGGMSAALPRVQYRRMRPRPIMSTVVFIYTVFLVMPDALQELAFKDILMVLTMLYQWIISETEHLIDRLAYLGFTGMAVILVVLVGACCARRHRRANTLDCMLEPGDDESDESDDDDIDGARPARSPWPNPLNMFDVELFADAPPPPDAREPPATPTSALELFAQSDARRADAGGCCPEPVPGCADANANIALADELCCAEDGFAVCGDAMDVEQEQVILHF